MTNSITLDERSRLYECEEVIERGLNTFVDVGNALLEIRDSKLYRQDFLTFEDYCRERWNIKKAYAYQLMGAANVVSNLSAIADILPTTETQARPLTVLEPEEQAIAWQQVVDTAPDTGITAKHVQAVVDEIQNKPHVANNSGNNEWYTPPEFIAAAKEVMGEIDLDPASSEIANKTVGAGRYFTAEDDGLMYAWGGNVWMNPPYSSNLIEKFVDKLIFHIQSGEIEHAIVLVNNATETVWFQKLLEYVSAVCFTSRRIKFLNKDNEPIGAPLQGQAILHFGDKVDAFADTFGEYGKVLYA